MSGSVRGSFDPSRGDLVVVLPDLMADPGARRIVLEAAEAYAAAQVAAAAAGPAEDRDLGMGRVGALFGALASRPYSLQAATDIRRAVEKSVVGLLETAGGKLVQVTKAAPVMALALEGGKAIIFDVGGDSSDRRAKERALKEDREQARVQQQLRGDLQAEIEHLTYVAVLSDPGHRSALGLHLSPDDIPEVTPALAERLGLGTTTREQWQRALFDDQGHLRVPAPSDGERWTLFRAWAEQANPKLRSEVAGLTEKGFNAMNSVGTT
ncbi:MAG: hypothetical protein ACRDY7_04805 [Acidimicrobiia bacterium]